MEKNLTPDEMAIGSMNSELTQLRAENERLKEQIELQKVNYINLSIQLHKITNP